MNTGFKLFLLCSSCATLMAQGYVYTFQGALGYQQLDGSYVILSNTVPGVPALADLLEVKILDSYGGAVFEVTVSAPGFNVTSFDAQGFNGSISGITQAYISNTGVRLVGMDSTPGIYASNNGFFPGNPGGEQVLGIWVASPIPEPKSLFLVPLGLAGLAFRRKRGSGDLFKNDREFLVTLFSFPFWKKVEVIRVNESSKIYRKNGLTSLINKKITS